MKIVMENVDNADSPEPLPYRMRQVERFINGQRCVSTIFDDFSPDTIGEDETFKDPPEYGYGKRSSHASDRQRENI